MPNPVTRTARVGRGLLLGWAILVAFLAFVLVDGLRRLVVWVRIHD